VPFSMTFFRSQKFLYIIVLIWSLLWLRNFHKSIKHDLPLIKKYIATPSDEKWKHVFGDDLYTFLSHAKKTYPRNAKIRWIRKLETYRDGRSRYYLYPMTQSKDPDFTLIYDK